MKFKQGELVEWDPETTKVPVGVGWICGLANTGYAIIGVGYIIELAAKIPGYDYSHIVMNEVSLTKASDMEKGQ